MMIVIWQDVYTYTSHTPTRKSQQARPHQVPISSSWVGSKLLKEKSRTLVRVDAKGLNGVVDVDPSWTVVVVVSYGGGGGGMNNCSGCCNTNFWDVVLVPSRVLPHALARRGTTVNEDTWTATSSTTSTSGNSRRWRRDGGLHFNMVDGSCLGKNWILGCADVLLKGFAWVSEKTRGWMSSLRLDSWSVDCTSGVVHCVYPYTCWGFGIWGSESWKTSQRQTEFETVTAMVSRTNRISSAQWYTVLTVPVVLMCCFTRRTRSYWLHYTQYNVPYLYLVVILGKILILQRLWKPV